VNKPDRSCEPATLRRLAAEYDRRRAQAKEVIADLRGHPTKYGPSTSDISYAWQQREREALLTAARLRNLATREERRRKA
jgi:ABC-type Fe3+-hydroxamate transport system substrate-binding protein